MNKKPIHTTLLLSCFALPMAVSGTTYAAGKTMIVTAEGLADPEADTYKRDKGLLIDALREDAKKQAIEKVVGAYVESESLVENYTLIHDRIMTKTKGLIKSVIKESRPWKGKDGFMHMLIKAEVYVGSVQEALKGMSRGERTFHIKQSGNPKISVSITVRNAERGGNNDRERSPIAENILKEQIKGFGYRVWSKEAAANLKQQDAESAMLSGQTDAAASAVRRRVSDFEIGGEAKFKKIDLTLKASGLRITKYKLTSWTVNCLYSHTGEEIYFNNKVPRKKTWASEDEALEDIGRMIGREFSKSFFEEHLSAASQIYELHVLGLPTYDVGELFKKEMIGLRPILNVDFRNYDANGVSLFEVEFTGSSNNFAKLVNNTVVKPLNAKLQERAFRFNSVQGRVIKVSFSSESSEQEIMNKFNNSPPASLVSATPERLKSLVQSKAAMEKVASINPEAVKAMANDGNEFADDALGAVKGF